mgnify:CR=1 FL=1
MCFHLVGQASRSKYPIGSGPSFAICVFPAIDFEVFNPTRVLCFRACVANKSPKSVLVLCRRLASSVFNRRRFLLLSVCVAGLSRRFRSRFLFRVAVWRRVFSNVGSYFGTPVGVEDSTVGSCFVSPFGVECFERQFLFVGLSRGLSRGFHSRFLFRVAVWRRGLSTAVGFLVSYLWRVTFDSTVSVY